MHALGPAVALVVAFVAAAFAPPLADTPASQVRTSIEPPEIAYDHDACNDPLEPERRDDGSLVMAGALREGDTHAWRITTEDAPHTLSISGRATGGLVHDLMLHDGCEWGCRSGGETPDPVPEESGFGGGCVGGVDEEWFLTLTPWAFADGYEKIAYEAVWKPCRSPDGWCGPMSEPADAAPS